jgi:glycosyltransferase involved in cell wall biosynthesis
MKILHIIDSGGLYGAEVVLLNLVAEQIKLGLQPAIASIGEKGIREKPLETEALKRGFKVKKFRMRPGPNYLGALKILRFAHQNSFDLMHSHGYKGDILFGFMPKSIRKLPLVTTVHGYVSINGFTKMKLYEWLDAKSLRSIDAVVLVSEAMRSHPQLKGRKGINLHVVHNGIPFPDNTTPSQIPNFATSGYQELDPTIVDFCNSGYAISSIGRLSAEKGYKYLIEAVYLLVKQGLEARLVIIGEGYERNFLEELMLKFELKGRVILPGYRENASFYLPYFKIFVLPSLTEGLPITMLEAMHAKIPIVATRVGGISEVLQNGRGGLLVEPVSPINLAEAISSIYHNPKLAKDIASASYREVVTQYTSETMALGYLDIYLKVTRDKQLH